MKKAVILIIVTLGVIFASCSSENEKDLMQKAQEEIKSKNYADAVVTLEKITTDFPKKVEAGQAYVEMAKLYQGRVLKGLSEKESYLKAVQYYHKVYEDYPSLEEAPGALFMCGFLQANELHDLTAAEKTYKEFLKKYPDHELAASAKSELENLGLTPEEILQKTSTKSQ